MAATVAQIAQLRRMIAEPGTDTYSDDSLAGYIEAYPLRDARGSDPFTWDASTTPPSQEANTAWVPTYDLHAAAADLWTEKAAAVAYDFQFSADGGRYSRHQKHEHAMKQARYHASRRRATSATVRMDPAPGPNIDTLWIGNRAEEE